MPRRSLLLLLVSAACGSPQLFGLEWSWPAGEVMATPMVADLDADGAPEVVVVIGRLDDPDSLEVGALVALDGAGGGERWRVDAHGRATPAIGDVDGDARPDVVHASRPGDDHLSTVHAVDADGKQLWIARTAAGGPAKIRVDNGAFALANLDDDPGAEVAIGGVLIDHDGLVVWQSPDAGGEGSPHLTGDPAVLLYPGGLATFADLTDDGRPELITGRRAWSIAWTPGAPPSVSVSLLWADDSGPGSDGYPAVADLDLDGGPEVVLSAWPEIHVLAGATGEPWCSAAGCAPPIVIPGGNLGGPATIADFDGDGRPELAFSFGLTLAVYDVHRDGEEVVVPDGDPTPAPGAVYRRWSLPIQDLSSASNGVMAFDLDGDGAADIAHQDECHLRVLDGRTGAVIRELESTSLTIHEYPVVADVDADGRAELLVAANRGDVNTVRACATAAGLAEYPTRQGLFVYGDGAWPGAPVPWTSHTHHLSNVDARGNAPADEPPAWHDRNSFREQRPEPPPG
ncbi:MAG: hypothetical protein JNL82_01685 [Myxococcales bacterium]|nr:hypothetical protein [Myxococcales bacterium]